MQVFFKKDFIQALKIQKSKRMGERIISIGIQHKTNAMTNAKEANTIPVPQTMINIHPKKHAIHSNKSHIILFLL